MELQRIRIHGHEVAYRSAGSGPVVVLVHGLGTTSGTWGRVMPALAERFTVVAVDLLGHGGSTREAGDYSLGAQASGIRDLMIALGHERGTLVGHSLGGGVTLQFAYQFPARCERLVLVDSGGLGRDVALHLRALSFPGVEHVMPPVAFAPRIHAAGATVVGWLRRVGLRPAPSFDEMWETYGALADAETRRAFFHTLNSVVDFRGQRPSAMNRLYLLAAIPTLIVWGARDRLIPVAHARGAHEAIPGSVLRVFEGVGHFPQHDRPEEFVRTMVEFIDSTAPAALSESHLGEMLGAVGSLEPAP
ncbi:MAG: alpha/beta fold hydrolase [Actinomycetota bacterium]